MQQMRKMTYLLHRSARILLFVIAALALYGCGGGGGGSTQPAPIVCDSISVLENGICRTFAARFDERATTPFIENGQPVTLEVVLFKPLGGGGGNRYPTIMFNHGSTGSGSDSSQFGITFTSKSIAKYFVDRGWMVAFPQRRGRGLSDGLYDEGFRPDRSGYSCDHNIALTGADRALDDLDAAVDWLRMRADVDTTQMLVGGTSRGGILSIAHVARRPDIYLGAINFVGGWLGEGCGDFELVNQTLFVDGASFGGMSIWLYGRNDSFYSLTHSQTNFDAFTMSGGMGSFDVFTRATGLNGHFLINDSQLWSSTMTAYLNRL